MPEVAVVTDSTAYLPSELIERYHLEVVPLYVVFGGDRTVRETEITDSPAFFDELRQAESLPTTSQPSVGDFAAVYEPLLAAGREVVSIHISGGLSGTPESARQAKHALERHESGADGWAVQHINAPEQCDRLADRCREIFGCEPALKSEIGQVLSA